MESLNMSGPKSAPHTRDSVETPAFDVYKLRQDFPILKIQVHGKPLVYLDNAATSQKPQVVVDVFKRYYSEENSNIHRGVHHLSERATQAYEDSRNKIRKFINARSVEEIIFVRGATEAINLVAQSYGRSQLQAGDEIIVSMMEHHSNIVPWQMLCEQTGAKLKVIPINDLGELDMEAYKKLLGPKTKFVSVVHVSNALGTINPVKEIIQLAHQMNVPVMLDGAQAAPHVTIDVMDLDCDFYTFSGHKVYGPTGVGILYGKAALLEKMPPYQGGGDMIHSVTFEKTTYNVLPYKFEAGTPHISGGIAMATALDYVSKIGLSAIAAHEHDLLEYGTAELSKVEGLKIIGQARNKASVISFVLDGIHPHDIGTILDQEGIAIRTGHHCAQPVMERFKVPATARASFALYNTRSEIDALVNGLARVHEVFR